MLDGLTSERLRFRYLSLRDHATLVEHFSHPESVHFLPPTGELDAYARRWILRQQARYRRNGGGLYALERIDQPGLIGQAGLIRQNVKGKVEWEVGYHLHPTVQGKGFASEAAQFCKQVAFEQQLSDSVISMIHADNLPSQKVAIRNGMSPDFALNYEGLPIVVYRVRKEK
ncbi:MAG: GNAT family N-acetyltransferase [Bacteroidota bacterium]